MNRETQKKKKNIFDILTVIVEQRKFIMTVFIVLFFVLVAFVFITKIMPSEWSINLMPDYYAPKAYINIQESVSSLARGASSQSSMLSMLMKGGGGIAQNPSLELAQTLLEGNTIKDIIIDEFSLLQKYGGDPDIYMARENARRQLTKRILLQPSKIVSSTLFTLSYQEVDSRLATGILKRTLDLLETKFKELNAGVVLQREKYIEENLKLTEASLKFAQDRVVDFSLQHGIVDLSTQAKEQTALLADLSADIIKKDMELQNLLEYMPEGSAKIVLLKKEIETKKQLVTQVKKGLGGVGVDVIPQNKIPSLTAEFLNLKAEMDIQIKIYGTLREQLELAKIEKNDSTQVFQIIEAPEILMVKSGPIRGRLCLMGLPVCFMLAIAMAFFRAYIVDLKKNPGEADKIENIKKSLKWNIRNKNKAK